MPRINGDLIPISSGAASLGVDQTGNSVKGVHLFDESTIAPYLHIHQVSGVWHDPFHGGSGVVRFNLEQGCFEVSVDGGITFSCLTTNANTVTSVGVLGDANLVGNVDFASPASGFIVIEDSSNASPLLWSLDTAGVSGLFKFPSLGFPTQIPACHAETFTAATTWTITHNLNSSDPIVMVYDASSPRLQIFPDDVAITSANVVTVTFNVAQAGRAVVLVCR
jgi:hypothetical protein